MNDSASVSSSSRTPTTQLNSRGGLVRARPEHAAHVQEHHGDHRVRRPAVHVAEDDAEGHDELQVAHAPVGFWREGHVVEHQRDARHREHEEEDPQRSARARTCSVGRSTWRLTRAGWMCRNRLEIIAAARSLSVTGQPNAPDRLPDAVEPSCGASSDRSRHVEAPFRPAGGNRDPTVSSEVDDQVRTWRERDRIPRQRTRGRTADDPPVLVVLAAVARALEAAAAVLHVAAKVRAHRRDAVEAVSAVEHEQPPIRQERHRVGGKLSAARCRSAVTARRGRSARGTGTCQP